LTDPEEAEPEPEPEPAPSNPVSVDDAAITTGSDVPSNGDSSDGRSFPGARRAWARISHTVRIHRSALEDWPWDWRVTFASLSGLIRGRRDGARENGNAQARQHFLARARVPSLSRAGTGLDYNGGLSCLRG
jgi:hypothetical protein